ncbi:unnamed protein product [Cuscuta campestris]|uniref:J domain-containing protein n=1 Tax=Cuscuta campestris TaxID=132261 RepID=A0A484NF90_9ASTE|nr:unnamed protein product [Cuscuta campestris]
MEMENLSRTRLGNGFSARARKKSLYEDVFGGPPKTGAGAPSLSPRLEDYTEIFGGFRSSRTSSIPVLDLPTADGGEDLKSLDGRASRFDYTQIFGRVNVVDFAISLEDLMGLPNAGYNSSDEAWSPAQSESLSDDSDPSAFSDKCESLAKADLLYPVNDVKQFNISYASDGTSHIARLQTEPSQLPPPARPPPTRPNPTLNPFKVDLDQPEGGESITSAGKFSESEPEGGYSQGTYNSVEWREVTGFFEVTEAFPQKSPEKFKTEMQQTSREEEMKKPNMAKEVFEQNMDTFKTKPKSNHGLDKFECKRREEETADTEKYDGRKMPSGDKTFNRNITKNMLVEEKRDGQEKCITGGKGKNAELVEALEICKNRSRIKESLWEEHAEKTVKWESTKNDQNLKMHIDHDQTSSAIMWEHGSKQFPRASQKDEQDDVRLAPTSKVEVDDTSEEADELVDIDWIVKDHSKLEELSEDGKINEAVGKNEENVAAFGRAYKPNIVAVQVSQLSEKQEESSNKPEETQVAFSQGDDQKVKAARERKFKIEVDNLLVEERFNSANQEQENLQHRVVINHPCLDEHLLNSRETGINIVKLSHHKKVSPASQMAHISEGTKGITFQGQRKDNIEGLQFTINKEVTKEKLSRQTVRNWTENGKSVLEFGEKPSQTDQRSTKKSGGIEEMASGVSRIPDELGDEYLKKMEEEREREREREKDRMTVTLERPYAESRQRVFEKAMAEKAMNGARERVDRSYSDRFSGNDEMRTHYFSSNIMDHQNQHATKLRYSYSANAGIEGETAQRCKSRIERYQRTTERAAKALAEKNMRDLLVQREQLERNRLAKALDAEVKRWSNGKEGNLRALLSTLQYILGGNSGWQAVPLTDIITSAAVKKAYRKATLCVHPDKLQQRGASIQQKYICEKVFDLLKEAWNKFNSEER